MSLQLPQLCSQNAQDHAITKAKIQPNILLTFSPGFCLKMQ